MIPLFGIPLYQTVVEPGISEEELKFIKEQKYERFVADNGFGSVDKFLLDKPELNQLKQTSTQMQTLYSRSIRP